MQITLANLKDATAQQVFDQVKDHLLTQGKPSKVGNTCAYRGDNGLMCAAGCLISDDEYTKLKLSGIENFDIGGGKNWGWLADKGYVPKAHDQLITQLQSVHDYDESSDWAAQLERVAISQGLD